MIFTFGNCESSNSRDSSLGDRDRMCPAKPKIFLVLPFANSLLIPSQDNTSGFSPSDSKQSAQETEDSSFRGPPRRSSP